MAQAMRIALLAWLRLGAGLALFASRRYNSTVEWSVARHIHASYPAVGQSNSSLVHVLDSSAAGAALQLASVEWGSCSLGLRLNYPSRHPRRLASLGNGKLVVWLLSYRFEQHRHQGEWRFAVVEPRGCRYRGFDIPDHNGLSVDVVDVVPYHDSFDVLVAGLGGHDQPRSTAVLRYSELGVPVPGVAVRAIPDLDSHPFYSPNTIRMYAVEEHNPDKGYFYVQDKPQAYTSVIKRLDANLGVIRLISLKHTRYHDFKFDAFSAAHGNMSICRYNNDRRRSLQCLLMDTFLRKKISVPLKFENNEGFFERIIHLNVKNLPNGDVLLVFALKTYHRSVFPIYAQRIEVSGGRVSVPKILGKVYCDIYNISTFELENDVYCVTVACDEMVHTRCITLI